MEDDLTWLARNVHEWIFFIDAIASVSNGKVKWLDPNIHSKTDGITRDQWLSRRAELQNKPSWKDAPEWACYLGQSDEGAWHWFDGEPEINEVHDFGEFWKAPGYTAITDRYGAVLGDWRDTLERRPAATPEPVVTKMMDEAIIDKFMGYVRAMPVSLSTVLSSEDLADLHQLCDAELTKRDAAVCGGQKYLDAHWFERGELPPIGEFVDVDGEDLVYGDGELNCEVIAHVENTAVIRMSYGLGCFQKHVLSPSRTERDKAIDEMKQHCPYPGSWDTVGRIYAEALYDAGYRKQNLPAK